MPKSSKCLLVGLLALQTTAWSMQQWSEKKVPALPPPQGRVVKVATVRELHKAVKDLQPGDTILIADGRYRIGHSLWIQGKNDFAIRGASGDPTKVVLLGKGWGSREKLDSVLQFDDCKRVSVAHLTVEDAYLFGIHVLGRKKPEDIHIYNVHFRNIGVRCLKGSANGAPDSVCIRGSVRFCRFENTKIPEADWLSKGNYISSIDMMCLEDWVFADNEFYNIKGRTGEGRAAIFIWYRSKRVTIERNLIVNCDRGIAMGNFHGGEELRKKGQYHADGFICRNNVISGGGDAGIEFFWSRNLKIYNNSIWKDTPETRGIRFIQEAEGIELCNNIVRGKIWPAKEGVSLVSNLSGALDGFFVKPEVGDLRLTSKAEEAIDKAQRNAIVLHDFKATPRLSRPDIGALEIVSDAAEKPPVKKKE